MRLDPAGREYWTPEMTAVPAGSEAIEVDFGDGTWHPLVSVEGNLSVLIAGPSVAELPHPAGTVVLPLGRTMPTLKVVGPGGVEVLPVSAGVIDVGAAGRAAWPDPPVTTTIQAAIDAAVAGLGTGGGTATTSATDLTTGTLAPARIADASLPLGKLATTLAAVATTGSYTDLSNKPSIPAAYTDAQAAAAAPVQSVAGRTGAVSLVKGDVGLSSVDNTSDAGKPVSTAQATAIALKADKTYVDTQDTVVGSTAAANLATHAGNTANPHAVTKAQVGLGSVDNTADTAKPVSTAQQTAFDLKAPLLGGIPGPSSNTLLAWSCDPLVAGVSGSALTNGTTYLSRLPLPANATVTKVFFFVTTVGVTPTAGQNFVGIYDMTGALKVSAGIDSVVTTLGVATVTVSSTALTAGDYWVALLCNAATPPQIMRSTTTAAALMNVNLTAATLRFGTNGTARTALLNPIVPSSNSSASPYPFWCAVAA